MGIVGVGRRGIREAMDSELFSELAFSSSSSTYSPPICGRCMGAVVTVSPTCEPAASVDRFAYAIEVLSTSTVTGPVIPACSSLGRLKNGRSEGLGCDGPGSSLTGNKVASTLRI